MKPPKPSPNKNLEELGAKARHAMEQRRHKEAIIFLKDLLKQERRPEWERALAEAYRLRAGQVAEKGMWQEAAILWENHAKLCPTAEASDEYLGWLAQAGQFPKLAQLLAGSGPVPGDGPFARRLPEALAVLALQNEKLLVGFPQDHPIAKHHAFAKQAIRAYSADRDAEAEEALKQIPSRSPYRSVRTLVKALLLMGQDRAAGLASLERIEADSLCHGLALRLSRQCQDGGPDSPVGTELSPKQHTLVGKLNGYSKAQLILSKEAKKFSKDCSPRQVFNAVLGNRELLGESACRRACLAMLVSFPEGVDLFQKAFGKLSPFERKRLHALHEESRKYYPQAALHWREAFDELKKRPEGERGTLDQALILRHIADLARMDVPDIAIDALEESVKLDPDDRASYVDLIKFCNNLDSPKEAQEWLEAGLRRFPKDVELLTLAMHEANRRKAYKKAASLAKTLLEVDPINSPARQFLLEAHLGHARKQASAGKSHLVQQELEQARALDPRRKSAALCVLEGLMALKDTDKASALLVEAWHKAGGGLAAQFQLNMETLSVGLPLKATGGLAPGLAKTHAATKDELLALAVSLGHYASEDKKRLAEALKPLQTILAKAFSNKELLEEDFFTFCHSLANAGQFDLLGHCAKEALRRFPSAASPIYFQVYASCKGVAKRMSQWDEDRLDMALERAREANDRRTAVLIEQLFRKLDEAFEEDYQLDDFMPGLEEMHSKLTPELERRIMKLETLSQAELLKIVHESVPGLPLKGLPREELLNLARLAIMGELGIDLKSLLGGLPLDLPFGPQKFR
jgi:tetratricopeptide (TPR) repeat protein